MAIQAVLRPPQSSGMYGRTTSRRCTLAAALREVLFIRCSQCLFI